MDSRCSKEHPEHSEQSTRNMMFPVLTTTQNNMGLSIESLLCVVLVSAYQWCDETKTVLSGMGIQAKTTHPMLSSKPIMGFAAVCGGGGPGVSGSLGVV